MHEHDERQPKKAEPGGRIYGFGGAQSFKGFQGYPLFDWAYSGGSLS